MNFKTIGCVELNAIALGFHAADEMVKSAAVDLIAARTSCPGRFIVLVSGDTGAVKAAVAAGEAVGRELVVDAFVIPSVHPSVLPALNGGLGPVRIDAVGVIETYATAACITAADAAAKAGLVEIVEIRTAAGLAGKAFVTLTGDVGSVEASVAAGVDAILNTGHLAGRVTIPSPSPELKQKMM